MRVCVPDAHADISSNVELELKISKRTHVLGVNFTPAAVKHRIICRENGLASEYNQRSRTPCVRAAADLNNSAIPLLNCYSNLPITDDSKVLTAANNESGGCALCAARARRLRAASYLC